MKNKTINIFFLLTIIVQQSIYAQRTPDFKKYGFDFKVTTLSNGKYCEFFDQDTIVKIGNVLFNTQSNEIVDIAKPDTTYHQIPADVISRWMSPDPLAEEYESFSPYHFAGNNPIKYIDLDGKSYSTHTDKDGNVLAVYNDGDLGVYKHEDATTKADVDKERTTTKTTSGNGEKKGETANWDEFVSPETGKTLTETNIQFGKSFDPLINNLNEKAQNMDLKEIAANSAGGGLFDIKKDYKNVGGLLNGKYATSRSAGNFLAGYNAEGATYFGVGVSYNTFQKLAGALHVMESKGMRLTNTQKADIILRGTSYGSPPTYGEVMYQYRMSKAGWDKAKTK